MTFEEWVADSFDHPVSDPAWYWDDELDDRWSTYISPELALRYFTRLLKEPTVLDQFSREQIAQGFWFLLSGVFLVNALPENFKPPQEEGEKCLDAVVDFFRTWVVPKQLGRMESEDDPLASVIFMWWDIWSWDDIGGEEAALQALRQILWMPSEICKESALHGLGHSRHWWRKSARTIEDIIDDFIASTKDLPKELVEYAERARKGQIE